LDFGALPGVRFPTAPAWGSLSRNPPNRQGAAGRCSLIVRLTSFENRAGERHLAKGTSSCPTSPAWRKSLPLLRSRDIGSTSRGEDAVARLRSATRLPSPSSTRTESFLQDL